MWHNLFFFISKLKISLRMIKYRYFFSWGKFGNNVYIGKNVKFFGDSKKIFFEDFAEILDNSIVIFPNVKKIEFKKNSSIGYNNVINVRGYFTLGENSMTGPFVSIIDSNHKIINKEKIRFAGIIQKDITIENDVWIGTGAIILMGVHIGEGAVVGANAVVNHSVEQFTLVAGNPAQQKYRR